MENWWMNKCNSTLPSIASSSSQELRNQMENAGYFSCPHGSQDLRPAMLGRLQDPLLSSIQSSGSHRSEHVNLGNSFLSLLSGSPSLLQRDFQDFSNSQPIGTSGKILPEGNNSILNGTQNVIPLSSTGLPSEKLSWKNLQSGADFCPNGSSKVVPSSICASNSVLHDLQSSDLAKVVICHMGPGNEKLKTSYASSGEWHSAAPASRGNIQISEKMPLEANTFVSNQASRVCHSASPADSWKACRENIHTSQKIPLEANSFISYQASSLWHSASPADTGKACRANIETSPKMPVEAYSFISNQPPSFMNGCPRVFCSTTSGYPFWADTEMSRVFEGRSACYFNTGVMVMDLVRWREGDYTRKIESWMEIQKEKRIYELGSLPPFLLVFGGDVEAIHHRWNQHGLGGDNVVNSCRSLHPGPVSLLHWSGKGKPWSRLDLGEACLVDFLWAPYDLYRHHDHHLHHHHHQHNLQLLDVL